MPVRVFRLDQPNLPLAPPTLELLLEVDGLGDLAIAAPPDQPINAMALGKTGDLLGLCCITRLSRLFVTPTYSVPCRPLARM